MRQEWEANMSKAEKIASMMSVAVFGFMISVLCEAIDKRWNFWSFAAVIYILAWHGVWGAIGIRVFLLVVGKE